jgi:ribosomal protein S18 acetylase RimI-like enzyme
MIRELTKEDVETYWELRRHSLITNPEAFGTTLAEWEARTLTEIAYRVQAKTTPHFHFMLGAFEEGQLVGSMGFTQNEGIKRRHKGVLWGVYILPAYRGRGMGGQLLDAMLARVRQVPAIEQVQLSVWAENKMAVSLYTSRGFVSSWLEKASFKTEAGYLDELHMTLYLKEPGS